MIHIFTNTKGGVGKSNTAATLASVLVEKGKKIKQIEFDNNNNSLKYKNSKVFNAQNSKTVMLKQKDKEIADILFDAMSEPDIEYIVDIGGGDDTFAILDALKNVKIAKTYYIPTLKIKKYLENAAKTFEYINDPKNTIFVLNQYSDLSNIKKEFTYFFGAKAKGIKPASPIFKDAKFIAVPYTDSFQIAEDEEMAILDFAEMAVIDEEVARKKFFEEAAGDRERFEMMYTKYTNALDAERIFEEIKENFWNVK
jgi:MinD-like ATPase involved in chromosome partitioning or flagellar assembly